MRGSVRLLVILKVWHDTFDFMQSTLRVIVDRSHVSLYLV